MTGNIYDIQGRYKVNYELKLNYLLISNSMNGTSATEAYM